MSKSMSQYKIINPELASRLKSALSTLKSPEDFRKWLEVQAPTDIVGTRGVSSRCPIANFMKQHSYNVEVFSNGFALYGEPTNDLIKEMITANEADVPTWVKDFVKEVDHCTLSYIPASIAIEVVDTINTKGA